MASSYRPGNAPGAGTDGGVAEVAPPRDDRSPWHWLLLLPVVVPLLTPLYNRTNPELGGWPFFYWFQLVLVALGVLTTSLVYLATRRSRAERAAAARAVREGRA